MAERDDSQSSGSTVPVSSEKKKNPTDLDMVVATEDVAEPTCVPECGSVSELINDTVEHLCMIDRDDSRGPNEVSSGARDLDMSPKPEGGKPTRDSLFGTQGQGWQKRGRFIIWPVSLGEDRHI